jgi:hypothetical protein
MGGQLRRALRWVGIAFAVLLGLLQGAAAIADDSLGWTQTISNGAIGTVGAVIWLRRPGLRIGQLLVGTAVGFTISSLKEHPGVLDAVGGLTRDAIEVVILVAGVFAVAAISYALTLFPDGLLPSERWRWVNILYVVYLVSGTLWMLGVRLPGGALLVPFGSTTDNWEERLGPMLVVGTGLVFLSLVALGVRLRRGSPIVRRQIGWVMYGLGVYILFLTTYGITSQVEIAIALDAIFFMGIPISIGVAIFRYRLFELDRIVNRSVVYLSVVALLAACYFGFVYFVGTVLPFESDVAVAASTLAVVGLFNPLRRRVQDFVDRRFFRSRYDATEVVRSFAGRLTGPVDGARLSDELEGVLDTTMRPESVGVWLRGEA